MTEAKIDPAPSSASAPTRADDGFDLTLVKEASPFSKVGLMIGGGVLALLFLVSLFNSPSEPPPPKMGLVEEPALPAAELAKEGNADAVADEATADAMMLAPITSADFPELADACNAADTPDAGDQCNGLGSKYQNGLGAKKNSQLAATIFDLGCAKGSMLACANAGMLYGGVDGVQQQPEVSFRLLKRACESEVMHGCAELGYNYENGVGVTQDKVRARQLYDLACTKGWNKGCDYRNSLDQSGNYMLK
jgi:TPR repeat protein